MYRNLGTFDMCHCAFCCHTFPERWYVKMEWSEIVAICVDVLCVTEVDQGTLVLSMIVQ